MIASRESALCPNANRLRSPRKSIFSRDPVNLCPWVFYNALGTKNFMTEPTLAALFWHKFPLKTEHRWLNVLLLSVPAAIVLDVLHAAPLAIFVASALAIAPLAAVLGESTGALASYSGPAVGGILTATM